MGESVFSDHWYRVRKLRPVLRSAIQIARHHYRGELWYAVRNPLTHRSHRFNARAYRLIGLMNGERTVEEIWSLGSKVEPEQAPTQDELIRLLGQMYDADLIQNQILPSTVELLDQAQGKSAKRLGAVSNPFFLRFPLCNPDKWLQRFNPYCAPLLSLPMAAIAVILVLASVVAAGLHWPELQRDLERLVFSPKHLLYLWLTYPLVKVFHEIGHACAVKKWGGEVTEMGVVLMALTPIPYVEASASAVFPQKSQRIAVAAMGMAVELLMASIALLIWLNVEPGMIRTLAANVMLIGGISTLLFNGNPLLRYDGYYILSDLLELPNLKSRATEYLGYLTRRYLFRLADVEPPPLTSGERSWFFLYGVGAFVYRVLLFVGLAWFVSDRFFGLGIVIAVWGMFGLLILPALKTIGRFLQSPQAQLQRSRVIGVLTGLSVTAAVMVFVVPLPYWTTTQGVIWLPEQAMVRPGGDCELKEVLVESRRQVEPEAVLMRGDDPVLKAQVRLLQARLEQLYAEFNGLPLSERVQRRIVREAIELQQTELDQANKELARLVLKSPAKGRFVLMEHGDLTGRFVRKGVPLGYVVDHHRPLVKAVVPQADIGLVRQKTLGVKVCLAEDLATALDATIERIVPAADVNLPTAALGTSGGGPIPVDPTDPEGLRAMDTLFHLDLSLPQEIRNPHIGGRVYVKFHHGMTPLAVQWYRSLRQLFLRKFYV